MRLRWGFRFHRANLHRDAPFSTTASIAPEHWRYGRYTVLFYIKPSVSSQ